MSKLSITIGSFELWSITGGWRLGLIILLGSLGISGSLLWAAQEQFVSGNPWAASLFAVAGVVPLVSMCFRGKS